jgi:hypothetical protein
MKTIEYKNKYGSLVLEIIGDYRDISGVKSKDLDQSLFFSIDIAEQMALITGNKDIQISFSYPDLKKAFVIHHQSSAVVALCRIVSIGFSKEIDATAELSRPAICGWFEKY